MKNFPFYNQPDAMDCGPTCLRMIAKYYGKNSTIQELRGKSFITREGVSMLGISDAAESIGFKTLGAKIILNEKNFLVRNLSSKMTKFLTINYFIRINCNSRLANANKLLILSIYF